MTTSEHQTVEERSRSGKQARKDLPRARHAEWSPTPDRPDPVNLLEEQNTSRLDWLIPVRRWRMTTSPFAFFRGSARIMAADLAATPVTGLHVQACGDAHLANFGLYASPERQLVFDINDFDETLPGPWEWDIKRLAASFAIAARHNKLKKKDARKATKRAARVYRETMAEFAGMRTLDIWYAMLSTDQLRDTAVKESRKAESRKIAKKAMTKDSHQALDKLAEDINGEFRIKSEPPGVIPLRNLRGELKKNSEELRNQVDKIIGTYLHTVPDDCKRLLDRYRLIDVALKVVGVGSVGTRCLILLLEGRDASDPLFLQMKEASGSVLKEYLASSPYHHQGQRVVEGQCFIQTVSDIFLGWVRDDETGKEYYMRQLKDWKGSPDVENLDAGGLHHLARLCGWTLAKAHARTGDPVAISAYLGKSTAFDEAMVEFAETYADQNQRDFDAFKAAIDSGKLEAREG